ncbi:unnamed protein product [Gongylonema pulchrum]|uniref:SHR-BD domain-containing protein n=1 Tax=Gongylonema pulchrum TaxID=637853 RepID=A0A183CUF5_9BILA|nr:unnamed protein product [Gongylonema pulchrum]
MYLIDIGQTELVDERSVYYLPSELRKLPPMAVPLVLANCRMGHKALFACKLDHFSTLMSGSQCVFTLCSSFNGQPLSLSRDGYYPTSMSTVFPPLLLARVFHETTKNDEIFCTWGMPEDISLNSTSYVLYSPTKFSFRAYALENKPPEVLRVRVTQKIIDGHYWLRDESLCLLIDKFEIRRYLVL